MIIGPEHLKTVSFAAGLLLLAMSGLLGFGGDRFRDAMRAFPRHRRLGIILTAAALIWSALMIDRMSLGEINRYKWMLVFLTPLSFYLVIRYLDELLAPRALAGLMMLAPAVMLDAARWHPSPWRYTVVILSYIMIVKGIWLMLCPFRFRMSTDMLYATPGRPKAAAVAMFLCAMLLFISGFKA